MTAIQSNAAAMSQNFTPPPGVSTALWKQTLDIADKGLGAWDRDRFQVQRHIFYHRVAYGAGTVRQTFFDVAPSDQVCNLQAPGLIGNDRAFILVAPRVDFIRGISVDGTASSTSTAFSSTTINPIAQATSLEAALRAGSLTLKVGTRTLVDRIPDLTRFPSGRGITGYGASNTTTSSMAVLNNGDANPNCAWPGVVYAIPGGKPISAEMNWRAAIAASITTTLELALDGYLVSPSND